MTSFEILALDFLSQGLPIRFRATGSSMRPFIFNNDVVEIWPANSQIFRKGDIVLFQTESGRFLLHRIICVQGERLLVQGDALITPDGWITRYQILGIAKKVYHYTGRRVALYNWYSKFFGEVWILMTPLRCWLQPGLQKFWRKLQFRKLLIAL